MMYRAAVCDDEKVTADDVANRITKYSNDFAVDIFGSGEELLASDLNYDIIFLDIEMKEIDGMATASAIRKRSYNGMIIFLTGHSEFMSEAFKVRTFRYLEKPVDTDKFNEAMEEAQKIITETSYIVIPVKCSVACLKITDIVCLEAYGDGTYIYDRKGKSYDSDKSLKYWCEKLKTEGFFRIHKSFAVSYAYISEITRDGKAVLKDINRTIDVSRRNLTAFRQGFFDYIRKHARVM